MTNNFDASLHIFRSPKFQSVVDDAVKFFAQTPLHFLPPATFTGVGVYGLYYGGDHELYARIAELSQDAFAQPIYVGKAVPRGWRTARAKDSGKADLHQRLIEHARSI